MTTNACKRCQGETRHHSIPYADGTAEPLKIRLHDLPVLKCEAGHKQFLAPQFPGMLLDHLLQEDEPELPTGEEKGLFKKRYLCESCGEELEAKPDHRHTFSLEVVLEELDPIGVDLTMPVYRCSGCGKEQMHSLKEVRKLTPEALAHAFQDADIPPG